MIDDIGGAVFFGLILLVILAVIWALAESLQRKQLESKVKELRLKNSELQKKIHNQKIDTSMIQKIFGEE